MISLLADENFNGDILKGLMRRNPHLDIVRVQDVGLLEAEDPAILEWAAVEGRILITHDVKTVPQFALQRVAQGLPMPGVLEISKKLPLGQAIEELLVFAECSVDGEWEGQVLYIPL